MILAFIKSTKQFCHARRLLSGIQSLQNGFPLNTCGNDSVGRFLFYSLPLNVSSRGQFYFETVNKYGDGMRVLVTGGFGFIGGYICRKLVNDGWKVRVFDIQNKADRPEFNLNGLEYVIGDTRDYHAVANALEEVDLIIHLAAKHRFFGISEEEFYSVNVIGTDVILKAASQKVI